MKLYRKLIALSGALALAASVSQAALADKLSYVVKVNGEPITSYDVAQRQKFMALTTGALGKRMRALMQSDETKQKFEQYMQQQRPGSREEAQALQKKFVSRLQQQVMNDIKKQSRDAALEELIEEQLMLHEAARHKVSVSDADIDDRLTKMAKSGDDDRTLQQFLEAFQKQGVNPETIRQRIRAQLAWRDVIRKLYGFRIASLVGASESESPGAASAAETVFDVQRLRIPASTGQGQAAVARAYVQGQSIRKQFSSCGDMNALAQRAGGARLESHSGKKATFFPRDARPLLIKASQGQMLPPVVSSNGIDLYAVCAKTTPEADDDADQPGASRSDRRQQEFQIYARRHLKDIRQDALIERR